MTTTNSKRKRKGKSGTTPGRNKYRCEHCGQVMDRDSTKLWIESRCLSNGGDKIARLVLIKEPEA